ncbi:MAG: hypothetical protein GF375_05865, partial [Candidatus Omnitrophica bacterium]|nr:hypothetical protein [Candidatus Omnitrophota bacterium]MBD3269501.1 hypothetical protein [Candidatus Omnitrophota bacterium]
MEKILIFNPFGIGDFLFTTPLVKNLKEFYPSSPLTYICNRRVYPLAKYDNFIDEIIVFEKDEWRQTLKTSKMFFLKKCISFFKNIKSRNFGVV